MFIVFTKGGHFLFSLVRNVPTISEMLNIKYELQRESCTQCKQCTQRYQGVG